MHKTSTIVWTCLLCAATSSRLAAQQHHQPIPLFDGKTLQGWEGDPRYWRVENGAIVGEIPEGTRLRRNTWLVWRAGKLADFDLKLQVKLTGAPSANSGIQFRCQVDNIHHVSGYQADLDQGAVWLGRIYDEHGRALLVERGTRVAIGRQGQRRTEVFAPAAMYRVLFRRGDWNDYRIVAKGAHVRVYINGTLFSELLDRQQNAADLSGMLALQLHSGPHTRVEFRQIRLEPLAPDDTRLGEFRIRRSSQPTGAVPGEWPVDDSGRRLNLGFEKGTLDDWTAAGDAFQGQPVAKDAIARRWPGQSSGKAGRYFIGGYELSRDGPKGTLTSKWFRIDRPYASFLVAGGPAPDVRVELLVRDTEHAPAKTWFTTGGRKREQMERVVVDLGKIQGKQMAVRLIDESSGAWGHLNFDDFRLHRERPSFPIPAQRERSTFNPILQHLRPLSESRHTPPPESAVQQVLDSMYVPEGFSVDVIAAEPRIHQPIAFTFDAKGRIWVAEAHSYPQKQPVGKGLDRIVILADADGDGRFETRKVFIEGLNLVSGLEVGYGGVWIGAAPHLLFIPDADRDDRPDGPPQVLLDGFGYADTHETLNNFIWGPDGWLYGNQGVFNLSRIGRPGTPPDQRVALAAGVWRYHPTRHAFEVFAHGGSNQWGLDYDDVGEWLMTQCRSRWGGGATTHIVQGGHYWNQVNGGYAPFISKRAAPERPWMRNYLLASARYGHGEGGAGGPGTRAVYGGHAHVGTMIYLGDNWPPSYRNHLFTHNLHGHQINHMINLRRSSVYQTVHAGRDVFLCDDPTYVAVDLKVGPDGAVYMTDWSDRRHCHNPNARLWDRSNGRLYRMQYVATYRPVAVDYDAADDEQLARAILHPNDWHVRTARRVLAERVARGESIREDAVRWLLGRLSGKNEPRIRLRALWALHAAGRLDAPALHTAAQDPSPFVRGWAATLAAENLASQECGRLLQQLISQESDPWVQRRVASLLSNLPPALAWNLIEQLAARIDENDRPLVQLLWYGLAQQMDGQLPRALDLARSRSPGPLRDYIEWYAAETDAAARRALIEQALGLSGAPRRRLLELVALATADMRGVEGPDAWYGASGALYEDADPRIRAAAETIGRALSDPMLYQRMRSVLSSQDASTQQRLRAIDVLSADASPANVSLFLQSLDRPRLAARVVPLLARYDRLEVADALLERLPQWPSTLQDRALQVLCSRSAWAHRLLDRIEQGSVAKKMLGAYFVRQMTTLDDDTLQKRLRREWGVLNKRSSAEKEKDIAALVSRFQQAPLWAFSAAEGKKLFDKHCASCHEPPAPATAVAPAISGVRQKGIRYIVENVIDPNAVIGKDYLSVLYRLADGRVINGLPESETASSITVRTATGTETIRKDEIEETKTSDHSLMPEGLLDPLNDRQRIELLKYLMTR